MSSDEAPETGCQHAKVMAVLVGGAQGDETIWLCANRDCKRQFIPLDPAEARETIARTLAEHREVNGFYGHDLDLWRSYACTCGWWSTADQEVDYAAHRAAAVLAALATD